MNKASYSIGIGGWEHTILDECFYPSHTSNTLDKLSYYASVFDTVEVRATFWDETLTGKEAAQWIGAVRDNRRFRFNVKLHSLFTHKKTIKTSLTRNVRDVLHTLLRADRLGALLIQFPYSFTNVSANRFHLVKLGELFAGYTMHVEFRHESWNHPSTREILSDHGLSCVSSDFPHVKHLMPYTSAPVNDSGYLRLHGRNEKGWLLNSLDARYDYLYNGRELLEIERRLEFLSRKCTHVTIIFNNTTNGRAVANALQLTSQLRKNRGLFVPQPTLRAFPHLEKIVTMNTETTLLEDGEYRRAM
jgi:uncharacterized protein YecE (DUF72 family)